MTTARVNFTGTLPVLDRFLRELPLVLAGEVPDRYGLTKEIANRMGVALLSQIQQAFLAKSRGGVGSDGIKWAPLSPKTIARRKLGPADRKALTQKVRTKELTEAQQKQARREYNRRRSALILRGLSPDRASALARAQAYNVVRGAGGKIKTRQEILGGRQVEILRDTSRLLRSLEPGVGGQPSGQPEQVFETPPGSVVVGTTVPYAAAHQGGIPGRMPARPLWPEDLPEKWLEAILEAAQVGLVQKLTALLSSRRV